MNKARIGSSLDSMFEELGELEEVKILTRKKVLARQLEEARQAANISISEMAKADGTSRMAVHSLRSTRTHHDDSTPCPEPLPRSAPSSRCACSRAVHQPGHQQRLDGRPWDEDEAQ